jgi:phytoene synthase
MQTLSPSVGPASYRLLEADAAAPGAPTVRIADLAAPAAHRADIATCRAMLRENSRTFFAASLLLPRPVREPASALYAFCRLADDAVDLNGGQQDAVGRLRQRLDLIYAGRPRNGAADRALAGVVARFHIPRTVPEAMLEGFAWDASGRTYETLSDLHAYGARVAGTVGVMMALVMGVQSAAGIARACDLGVAMQLSNIARDVGEDARLGRLYLPRQWMREAGLDPDAWLAKPVFSPALGSVVQRLLSAADTLYRRVDEGIALLPMGCRPGINAARFLYAEIGREVERHGLDSVSHRAVVPSARKAWLLTRALVELNPPVVEAAASPAPLAETRYLVEAAAQACAANARAAAQEAAVSSPGRADAGKGLVGPAADRPSRWSVTDRAIWLIDLFERLERRDRLRASGATVH